MNKEFKLKTNEGNVLDVSVYGLENISKAACLILVHGFKGFKDWGFFPFTAEHFAKCGYFVITFNFSHNGIKGNDFMYLILIVLQKTLSHLRYLNLSRLSMLIKMDILVIMFMVRLD